MPIARSSFRGGITRAPLSPRNISVNPGNLIFTGSLAAGSPLAQLAASMAPGTWAQLTSASNQDAVLGVGPSTGCAIPFMNTAAWYAPTRGNGNIHILGSDHTYANGVRDSLYSESSNSFVFREENIDGSAFEHGYDHNVVNPYNGDLYLRRYNSSNPVVYRKKIYGTSTGNWVAFNGPNVYAQVAIGSAWWSGMLKGAGSQGAYLLYTSIFGDGRMMAYDPVADTWFLNSAGFSPGLVVTDGFLYADVVEYSAFKNVAVYGGCNDAPRQTWKMLRDHSVVTMPLVPTGKILGVGKGNFVCDPITGNFLLLSAGELWELNPDGSGTWTQQTGTRTPPSDVGSADSSLSQWVISCAIPEYGVIAYIKQTSASDDKFYLYKHAADDWVTRSTAAGVEVADRLDSAAKLSSWVVADGSESHVSVDSTVKPYGATGSFKFSVLSTDDTSSGAVCVPFAAKGAGNTIWFSYRIRADDAAAYQQWTFNAETGIKLSILSRDFHGSSPTGSNQINEIVAAVNYSVNGFDVYHQDGNSSAITSAVSAATNCSGSDFKFQPKIDNGANPLSGNDPATGSAWTSCQQDRARYGGLYSAKSSAEAQDGLGDPLSGAVKQDGGFWYTVTFRCTINHLDGSTADNRITMWVAREGEAYRLLIDDTTVVLGGGPSYTGLWLIPYVTNRSSGGRQSSISGISGVSILGTGGGTATGSGTLEYVASTGAFRFKASNDSYGTARYISAANGIYTMNLKSSTDGVSTTTNGSVTLPQASIVLTDASSFPSGGGSIVLGKPDTSNSAESHGNGEQYITYTGKSGNTLTGCSGGTGTHDSGVSVRISSYISVRVESTDLLPASGTTTATVTVSSGRKNGQINYADVIISSQAINAPGGYAPTGAP